MKTQALLFSILLMQLLVSCNGQQKNNPVPAPSHSGKVGGDCEEGYCELMYVGIPKEINNVDTSAGWYEAGRKLLVTGTVYQMDGKTPAPHVIVYYHHTDNNGHYSPRDGSPNNSTRHGHIRGWVKTDADGRYSIYSIRPGPYPGVEDPEHIHLIIKEPDIANEYWIDDLVFDDDPRLLPYRKTHPPKNPRCGSGTLRVLLSDSMQVAEHNIILGLNIPNYPKRNEHTISSGLNIGDEQPSFGPYHAYGPDKGSTACPVCKYGRYQGIIYYAGNQPNWNEIKKWLQFLESESNRQGKYLKVYFVYGSQNNANRNEQQATLEKIGKELNIRHTALTYVPSWNDKASDMNLNKINPDVENTFIVYKQRNIVDKFINLKPTEENFVSIKKTLNRTQSNYLLLPEPEHE
ncbi:MAG TPA: hypothetical protein PKZ71_06830 [Chitinophagaceae bacterium]|nr:hypothetical protein [Chitinophagaceae bacterium]